LPESAGMYFLPKGLPETAHWYRNNSITIQFVLLLLLAVILVIFRKRVHYEDSRRRN
jgi:hypothetical protein